jgi:hypothetical protein
MDSRTLLALAILLLTLAGIGAALVYATREQRAERSGWRRDERVRLRARDERRRTEKGA